MMHFLSRTHIRIIRHLLLFGGLVLFAACTSGKKTSDLSYLRSKYENSQSKYVEIDGLRVHYREEGKGYPVLLLHGIASSLHTWDGWVNLMKDDYKLIRLDLPGFGLTGPNAQNEYSPAYYVGFLSKFLNNLDVSHCYVAGNSLGGWIGWEFALAEPDRVKKLVLLDAAGYLKGKEMPKPVRMARKKLFKPIVLKGAPRFIVKRMTKKAYGKNRLVTKSLVDRYFELGKRPGNPLAFYTMVNYDQAIFPIRIKNVTQPTLILWGEKDTYIRIKYGYLFDQDILESKLISYPKVGHVPMEEAPEKTVKDVFEFFDRDPN